MRLHQLPASLALALLVSCGAGAAETTSTTTTTASDDRTALPERCEGACTTTEPCQNGIGWRCECTEHADVNCGGAPRPPMPGYWAWTCTPLDPRADRGDGCPFTQPEAGEHCEGARVCRYAAGVCGWDGVDAHCEAGAWRLAEFHLPPPP